MKYLVQLVRSRYHNEVVEANSEEEAIDKVYDSVAAGEDYGEWEVVDAEEVEE